MMRIGIIGSGALGLYYGAMLQRGGHEVHFLLRRDYQAIHHGGLQVRSVNGDFHLKEVNSHRNSADIGPVDLVLIGLKTFANQYLLELVYPLLGRQTCLLTLQNGLGNEELLAGEFGTQRVLGGVAFLCSNRGEPGTVHHLGEGKIRLGEFVGGPSPRSESLAELFRAAKVPCEAVADLRRARWEKLVWNIPFNGLSALHDLDVTELLAERAHRQRIEAIMQEVLTAANAQPLHQQIDAAAFSTRMLFLTEQMDHYQPSMLVDRRAGRQLELDAIFAQPLQCAAAAGITMPQTALLHNQLLARGAEKN